MNQKIRHGQVIQASLHPIDVGLYAITYRPDPAGWEHHTLPVYQVGSCAADAKQRVEMMLKSVGYQTVTWIDAPTRIKHSAI